MNILVLDVQASDGGALSILTDFYEEVCHNSNKDIKWYFVISTPFLEETKDIKILRFPWVKKSWIHRLYFDNFIVPKLIKKHNIDKIFSLQSMIVPYTNISQIVYVHQPLPFSEYKFSFKENKLFWIYQNIISKQIFKSIKKADKVIVQTEWFKKACIKKTGINSEKIVVIPPKINIKVSQTFLPTDKSLRTFFYPARGIQYKNHKIIIESVKKLKNIGFNDFKVLFTLKGNENKYILNLVDEINNYNLPIEFIGNIAREEVFDLYTKSVLLFPSYIETFGLPLLEAKLHKTIILASDMPFSHEILDGYPNAYFFNPFNKNKLYNLMEMILTKKISYKKTNNFYNSIKNKKILDFITKK
ncbi:glycosyltransferase [Marinitoga piezophila KA3]|uniref:Glycosyltransferase n=1 Tax=Marinitoga piezophila (strain DSM 14283 / JCM 11233 / KA3) TaxID=443254 RepID=H2J8B5_MARPK|nr:glycosyltransferase [Marinitoga piezophila]AEX85599.1 glycosyltransferase [Marinitoga piezophila KA3]